MEELLRRYIHGEVSDEERMRVARWLDEDSSHMREFMALRKLYDISLWQSGKEETSERKEIFGGRVRRMPGGTTGGTNLGGWHGRMA